MSSLSPEEPRKSFFNKSVYSDPSPHDREKLSIGYDPHFLDDLPLTIDFAYVAHIPVQPPYNRMGIRKT